MAYSQLAIVGGTVVNDDWSGPASVFVQGRRIARLAAATDPVPEGIPVIDASGRLVLPGGVDPHTHIQMSLGDYTTRDGYREATTAAVWGGTTTVVDFAIPRPGERPLDAVRQRQAAATEGVCDAALHACVVEWDDTVPEQLRQIAALGIRTVKLFTTYRDVVMADPATVVNVMRTLQELGGMAYVHAESNHLIEHDQQRAVERGQIDAAGHASSRSELAEVTAVREVLSAARSLGAPVYFVHQSTPAAIDEVRRARSEGVRAYTETCPHYLALDDQHYAGDSPELFVCCPPLRSPATVSDVVARALAGDVDTIGSDHCCYDRTQKWTDRSDVRVMPNGLPGVETRLPVIFTELVQRRGMPVERFVAITSANPARLNGIYPQKGVIAPGSDADLILIDPTERRTVSATDLHMATDYSPYEGRELAGWASTVIVGGTVVLDDGVFADNPLPGRALVSQPLP
ncbi:dihydropyrimidinase [Dactylosporangium sp. NPDC048998]|uniref:dihydropyrimidinase n=1 Tax=Dactylosporangium sp. NPDC048998 TaxID=3363976 RepID=UPI003717FD0F